MKKRCNYNIQKFKKYQQLQLQQQQLLLKQKEVTNIDKRYKR